MQLWTFGLISCLLLCTWFSLPVVIAYPDADEQDELDDVDDHEELYEDCHLLRKRECWKRTGNHYDCTTTRYPCSNGCHLYDRTTVTSSSHGYIFKTVYLCPTSTVSQSKITSSIFSQFLPTDGKMNTKIDDVKLKTKFTITPSIVGPSVVIDGDSEGKLSSPITTSVLSKLPRFSGEAISSTPPATLSPSIITQSKASSLTHDDNEDNVGDDGEDGEDGDDRDGDDGDDGESDDGDGDDDGRDGDDHICDDDHSGDEKDEDDTRKPERRLKSYEGASRKQSVICQTSSSFQSATMQKRPSRTKSMATKIMKWNSSDKQTMSSTPSSMITRTMTIQPGQPRNSFYSVFSRSISSQSISPTTRSPLPKLRTSTNIQKPDGTKNSRDISFLSTPVLMTSIFTTMKISSMLSAVPSSTSRKQSKALSSSDGKRNDGDDMSTSATFNTSTRILARTTHTTIMSTEAPSLSTSIPTSGGSSFKTIATPPLSSTMSSKLSENTMSSSFLPSFTSKYSSTPPLFSSISSTSSGNVIPSTSSSFGQSPSKSSSSSPGNSSGNIASSPSLSSFKVNYSAISTESSIAPTSSSSSLQTFTSSTGNATSESTRIITPTPTLSTMSENYSVINATVIVVFLNKTQEVPTSITPTRSILLAVSSSVAKREHTVYCRGGSTGEKFEKGTLEWDKTPVGDRAKASCKYNRNNNTAIAYRYCMMNTTTMAQYWGEVHDENCSALEKNTTMKELNTVEITEENESTMAVLIDYITATSNATVDFVKDGANFLEKLIDGATHLSKIRKDVLSSISNVMNADPAVLAEANKEHQSTTKILKKMGKLMDDMSLSGQKRVREKLRNLVAEAWDVANKSEDLKFVTNSTDDFKRSLVSVTLPTTLLQRYTEKTRITFINFMNDNLFPQNTDHTKKFINSKIVFHRQCVKV
ncbi:flocculation protein FLO11-like [Dendronephthya gigantea]|uniref:flocculation protein FLO11-like n=1 Tax=Dendronephthya gigantea TaxID=151771 RepID=UPI00106B9D24|nr:flocculation protein FLO11-like [Dendronephthya gigantea]